MAEVWDEARILQLISNGVQEDVHLEYKSAGALGKQNDKRDEITKDVSAMANSDGGQVIYGIHESNEIPSHITPVDRQKFPKNWLEQVIGNIRPHIEGVRVHKVELNDSSCDMVYVVEVPKSDTVHQAADKTYYKRSTSHSVPMEHFEILDVLNRKEHPRVELELKLQMKNVDGSRRDPPYDLEIRMVNSGNVYAQYVVARIEVPMRMVHDLHRHGISTPRHQIKPDEVATFRRDNTIRDVVGVSGSYPNSSTRYGPKRYDPLLPTLKFKTDAIKLNSDFQQPFLRNSAIRWTTYADSAPPRTGEVAISDLPIHDGANRIYYLRDLN